VVSLRDLNSTDWSRAGFLACGTDSERCAQREAIGRRKYAGGFADTGSDWNLGTRRTLADFSRTLLCFLERFLLLRRGRRHNSQRQGLRMGRTRFRIQPIL